jgi:hypothetical protein
VPAGSERLKNLSGLRGMLRCDSPEIVECDVDAVASHIVPPSDTASPKASRPEKSKGKEEKRGLGHFSISFWHFGPK